MKGAALVRADAIALPLADESVDLIVTSPPYFALRSYTDGGEHYDGQIGSEPTPQAFLDALWAVTAECKRVLKPSGSMFVNLGDSYSGSGGHNNSNIGAKPERGPKSYRRNGRGVSTDGRPHHWTREHAAWLAAVIDCDGSISARQVSVPEGRSPSFVGWVRIGMMDREVCDQAAWITGLGEVFQDKRGVWNWHVTSQQARWVLQRILPWLLIKRRQALAVIELARHVEKRKARGSWSPLTEDDITYRQLIKEAVQTWNKRRPHGWEPPECEPIPLPYYEWGPPAKSLHGLPWRYAIGCVDQLDLILRAEIVWNKPNGLPESVSDRVRRSHEQWFHFTREPRYFAAVDEVRELHASAPHAPGNRSGGVSAAQIRGVAQASKGVSGHLAEPDRVWGNPLGKLPGSVWTVPTEPLVVPQHLNVDHFAAFPQEFPRRFILGWSPPGAVILDPFAGTGTVSMVARALGRYGVSVDLSADYLRLARWRIFESGHAAKSVSRTMREAQGSLLDGVA